MRKKKKTKQKNNLAINQPEMRVIADFDYEKLANIILEKNNKPKAPVLTKSLKYILFPILWLITISTLIIICAIGIAIYQIYLKYTGTVLITSLLVCFVFIAYSVVLLIFTIRTLKEIDKINDYNVLSSILANILAIIALIVSFAALNAQT